MSYRPKLILFFLSALAVWFIFNTGYSALSTLSRLDAVEAERDQWQRPSDVIAALNLNPGGVVVDLGCGSGYFSVRLAQTIVNGKVIAEDIRTLPLVFLWLRTVLKGEHNMEIVRGTPDDPRLPLSSVNAVLIANTYHEFSDSHPILLHVIQSLLPGGRLVVVDRAPSGSAKDAGGPRLQDHEISSEQVQKELELAGFDLVSRQDRFIENDPQNERWWLIVARKPLSR